jgi:light-regulated signal transduction histidine kinase (bacteriophytochrome)
MDQATETLALLEQIPQPIFLVKDNHVCHVNQGARQHGVEVNTPVSNLISIGMPEYKNFSGGKLMLTVSVNDITYNAVITKADGYDMFCLDSEYATPELRALALAAQALREPLSGAMLSVDKLMPEEAIQQSPALLAQMQLLNRNIYQLHRAIRNMSDAAIYQYQTVGNFETGDVVAVIAEIVQKAAVLVEKANRRIVLNDTKKSVLCPIDREKLERAILNLISNAIKYTDDESAVQVSLRTSKDKLYVCVESKCSTEKRILNLNIFAGFNREPGIENTNSGIGLGLTIAHGAAAAHKGTLLVEQTDGSIRFTLSVALQQPGKTALRSPVRLPVDYSGGYDQALIELSDVLPPVLFE